MARRVKVGTRCAYCDVEAADERDHIPPKGLYPPSNDARPTVQRITIPACSRCNRGWSDDECDGLRRLLDLLRIIEPVRASGVDRWMIYPGRDPPVLRVVRKIVRGLAYYHGFGVITLDARVSARLFPYLLPTELLAQQFHHCEPDVFEYWYQPFDEGDFSSVWVLRFYEKRIFVAAIAPTS